MSLDSLILEINVATDMLNAKVAKLEDQLRARKWFVEAVVSLERDGGYGPCLIWSKSGPKWGLYVYRGSSADMQPLLNEGRDLRAEAAKQLPLLVVKIRENAERLAEKLHAADVALDGALSLADGES